VKTDVIGDQWEDIKKELEERMEKTK